VVAVAAVRAGPRLFSRHYFGFSNQNKVTRCITYVCVEILQRSTLAHAAAFGCVLMCSSSFISSSVQMVKLKLASVFVVYHGLYSDLLGSSEFKSINKMGFTRNAFLCENNAHSTGHIYSCMLHTA
jgi:hypothetical protein